MGNAYGDAWGWLGQAEGLGCFGLGGSAGRRRVERDRHSTRGRSRGSCRRPNRLRRSGQGARLRWDPEVGHRDGRLWLRSKPRSEVSVGISSSTRQVHVK